MKKLKFLIILICCFFITGCWNYRELNELSTLSAMGIDIEGDDVIISINIVNASQAAGNTQPGGSSLEESPTTLYQVKSKTIKEAINNIVFEAPRPLYTGHMSLLAIGEEVAKNGIYDYLDFFMADTEIRKIFPVVVVENGKASDLLKLILPLQTITAEHLNASLESGAKYTSYISNRKFDDVINCLYKAGRHLTMSSVRIIGSPEEGENVENVSTTIPKNSARVTGSAVFNEDKLVGYLHDVDSLGFNIIRGFAHNISLEFPCDKNDNYGNANIEFLKSKMESEIKNDKPTFTISVKGAGSLPEYNCKMDKKNKIKAIEDVEKMVEKEMKKIINNTIIKLQKKYKSDIIGFGENLYENHYKYWKTVEKNWDEHFATAEYKIKVDINLDSIETSLIPAKER